MSSLRQVFLYCLGISIGELDALEHKYVIASISDDALEALIKQKKYVNKNVQTYRYLIRTLVISSISYEANNTDHLLKGKLKLFRRIDQ